jgi:hypothetical protein
MNNNFGIVNTGSGPITADSMAAGTNPIAISGNDCAADAATSKPPQEGPDQPESAVHRTIVVVDVAGFGDRRRTNPHQKAVRDGLYGAVAKAFDKADIPWGHCYREDRGDGLFLLVRPEVPKEAFVTSLPWELVAALREHNSTHSEQARIRLRMALHAGEIRYDGQGVTGESLNLTFRLVEAPALKSALARSAGVLALFTARWFFDEVVRHAPAADSGAYREVRAVVKETEATARIYLPDQDG